MKKILLLLVVSFFVGKNCEAQNLVPNPSFEQVDTCPNYISQITRTSGWINFGGTTDYFNSCSQDTFFTGQKIVSIPENMCGYENAATGNAYAGFITYESGTNWKEFLAIQLSSSLSIGIKYYVKIKVSLADSSNYATNNLGISFSTIPLNYIIDSTQLPNSSKVNCSTIISDTSNWNTISGNFIADSIYKYVIIGNFFDDTLTDISFVGNTCQCFTEAYYYIDDVCVSLDSLACDLNPEGIYNLKETKASINLYPNPVSEQLAVNCEQVANRIEIINSLGVKVYAESGNLKSKIINLKSFTSGIYFIKVYFGDGSMEVRRFVKE